MKDEMNDEEPAIVNSSSDSFFIDLACDSKRIPNEGMPKMKKNLMHSAELSFGIRSAIQWGTFGHLTRDHSPDLEGVCRFTADPF